MNRDSYYDFRKKVRPRPTAAALRYDPLGDEAPEILATGHGLVAEQILQIAKENDVPLHQDAARSRRSRGWISPTFCPVSSCRGGRGAGLRLPARREVTATQRGL